MAAAKKQASKTKIELGTGTSSWQDIQNFGAKYNWLFSSFVVHCAVAYFLAGGQWLALVAAGIISLDHAWVLKVRPYSNKRILDNLTHSRPKDRRDVLHKLPVFTIAMFGFVLFRFFVFDQTLWLIFFGVFVHLLQDFLEDYLFFENLSGWNY